MAGALTLAREKSAHIHRGLISTLFPSNRRGHDPKRLLDGRSPQLRYNLAMYTLRVRSAQREELVEFTDEVQRQLKESGAREGVIVLYVQHTTAGLTVNENADPDVPRDMLHAFRTLIPQHGMGFRHGEENSDAHIKATLVGSSVTVPFKDGKLLLGRWQGIFLCEFDGGRERQVIMTVLPAQHS